MTEEKAPAPKKKTSLLPLIALNIALLGVMGFVVHYVYTAAPLQLRNITAIQIGQTLPAFGMARYDVPDGSEDSFGLETLDTAGGKLAVINIFASWCKPCEAEHPYIKSLGTDYGLPVYGIALKDEPDDIKAFLDRLGNPYRAIGLDYAGLMLSGLGLAGVPTTIIIDKDYKVLFLQQGPVSTRTIDEHIAPLLARVSQ
jgi:cytochrome c biogenesis protein CcmG/thiol:disulfide interchange protein DsbE